MFIVMGREEEVAQWLGGLGVVKIQLVEDIELFVMLDRGLGSSAGIYLRLGSRRGAGGKAKRLLLLDKVGEITEGLRR